ncbi:hypothetical protein ASPWEDRAFT_400419 [Aspergillus wentii DTO 134E9]|uniref:Uncharacterized protein n=1 Tax=Aspergillus wentii DTO 134E9 TaxID=1073089 RepID=A0A1L9RYA4_ASPWE|nr:uncharacterized protein ASPWEDRAFT_400419 [Aspergillus wentii DTO 134E9]OJJ39892.1 hypothetical protein ASPWEDRAFT_400419 [Aspergillus wentii DTO 134E9]
MFAFFILLHFTGIFWSGDLHFLSVVLLLTQRPPPSVFGIQFLDVFVLRLILAMTLMTAPMKSRGLICYFSFLFSRTTQLRVFLENTEYELLGGGFRMKACGANNDST